MSILFEQINHIARITLNRPDKLNSFNREMALLLQDYLDQCKDDSVRCVYITGNGKAFSAGQDLAEVTDPNGPGMNRILSEHYNPIVIKIRELKKPVVSAINGVAAGAGANIALCCDIAVAAESASFIQAFSKIGLIPDSGGTFFLPRLIGWQKASAIMMLGDKIDATTAERWGMLYRVFPDEQFAAASWQIAETLSNMPTIGLAYTKKGLQWGFTHTMYEQLQNEDKLQQWAAATEDFKEGVAAFIEKRKPQFNGK
ncbi:MAG: 2-(1,2-epoxy-1,2-dihydrophenyl)acetyl-CoA isomerase [Sphingobacteriales bacterium SCN 48-20]|uniref:enoyl-CoA hydratase-related protein n=1 Tax=Terrimonas ferruginea TaxID=249 RepID=UPI0008685259|nr:enoyl-CoA hydratase-related protein [Terrimonas ferruginea]MBN8784547.1 enoyl-CoA hydratase/isomerase family protein [Terrimonas ferruginea]ODT92329.1 MAG: 2-(1,2-epoxy-1,2-dihydrophenyl)acetyl-CoA isomerase [Sphingobacteriales bacterium SCN 48-20]OJW40568.1 MAG: 2-(1,2-epoxy-1,2-dihydrophenyl)acetyl-CoA isomerase [Sphingobacteriales bacterium 48-107]